MTVTIAQLPLAALRALAAGDAAAATRLSPVPLSPWLTGAECAEHVGAPRARRWRVTPRRTRAG